MVRVILKIQIDFCLNQSFVDFELIIVDDCSTDDTKKIILEYNDPRIKLIVHNQNKKLPAALIPVLRNVGENT